METRKRKSSPLGKWSYKCFVAGCKTTNLTTGVKLIHFPNPLTNPLKCTRWLRAVRRGEMHPSCIGKNSYICTLHWKSRTGPTVEEPDPSLSEPSDEAPQSTNDPPNVGVKTNTTTSVTMTLSCATSTSTTSVVTSCVSSGLASSVADDFMDELGVSMLPNSPTEKRTTDHTYAVCKRSVVSKRQHSKNGVEEAGANSFCRTLTSTKRPCGSADKSPARSLLYGEAFQNASPSKRKRVEPAAVIPKSPSTIQINSPSKAKVLLQKALKFTRQKIQETVEAPIHEKSMCTVETQTPLCLSAAMSYEKCSQERQFQFLCGLSHTHFKHLYENLGGEPLFKFLKYQKGRGTPKSVNLTRQNLSLETRLFLTLVRLRRGFTEEELAYFFGCHQSYVSRIFSTWVQVLYKELRNLHPFLIPYAAEQEKTKPACFSSFSNVRVIVDCVEFKMQRPSNFAQQGNTWSDYKSSNTAKVLVGVTMRGGICFISKAYEGSASDKQIFLDCGILDFLEPGDAVMVDRGFTIESDLKNRGIRVIMPPFKPKDQGKFTGPDALLSRKIASARIHVERMIGKMRHWTINNQVQPQTSLYLISQIAYVTGSLTNYCVLDL